ncbi:enoyl-CoA hydratase/isomerase family protein [Mycolicibacterium sp. 018/SC-01/001]|uniref:enoyl-CoA hydratase/isomerase family protein n=1 Tax=Mycolicibacterium sp. 018/SC-01/001 TaxID=2592069 RepID=UPI00117C7C1B|nr:enoyl-CoA hydratase/isomerase family protein [Mycolicibacterium sp. 018/SC-01/001]TRW79624.1 enoyl-CoA hydratase/isomerase family protein [Mycolicibacterium sp. 018/SC-01/001]
MSDIPSGTAELTGCDEILVAADGPVRIVTLNNPENANAVNNTMHTAFSRLWSLLADDPDARAVLLTGSGDFFSAGGDLVEWLHTHVENPVTRRAGMRDARRIVRDMIDFPLPVVAAVNGPAIGFGCSIAVLCDIVLMSDRAFLADTHVASGLVAGDGGSVLWPLLMSLLKAKEYLLLGERISATTAVELGLANRVLPHADTKAEGLALAHRLAALPPRAVQDTKRTLNLHAQRALTGILEYGISAETECFTTDEHRAAIDKFLTR